MAVLSHNKSSLGFVYMSEALESATPVVTALISHHLRFSPLHTRCLVAVLTGQFIHINVIILYVNCLNSKPSQAHLPVSDFTSLHDS